MRKKRFLWAALALILAGVLITQIPAVKDRLLWGWIQAEAYLRGVVDPAGAIPTPMPTKTGQPTSIPPATATPTSTAQAVQPLSDAPTPTQTQTPEPLPESIYLEPPEWERQDINGCGPATLSMYLQFYGWEGDQFDINQVIKPDRADRNVNIEELDHFTGNYAGWLSSVYRVGGDIETLKRLLAAGVPVMIEEGDELAEQYWPGDDRWAGHFLLMTGYNEAQQSFIAQDSFRQPDRLVSYENTDARWKPFNRIYYVVYLPHQEEAVRAALGEDWDETANQQNALEAAQAEIAADETDALAWFNLGSNLVSLERFGEAADAFDQARILGLPQRMLRYQFGPYHAYLNTERFDDVLALANHTLQITPNSEEAFRFKGWAHYYLGEREEAIEAFRNAYSANPTSWYAQYALEFMEVTP